jgi:hypothetical protein
MTVVESRRNTLLNAGEVTPDVSAFTSRVYAGRARFVSTNQGDADGAGLSDHGDADGADLRIGICGSGSANLSTRRHMVARTGSEASGRAIGAGEVGEHLTGLGPPGRRPPMHALLREVPDTRTSCSIRVIRVIRVPFSHVIRLP